MMGCRKCILLSAAVLAALLGYATHFLLKEAPLPNFKIDEWWGPGSPPKKLDTSIRPFKIQFKPEMVSDLQNKLAKSQFYTEPLEGIGFEYGFNNKYLKEIVEFWKTEYKFKERETYLNQFPQFKTNIQGLDIHYLHVKPKQADTTRVIPILLLHGWPGSVVEFYRIIPMLMAVKPEYNFVFEVIAPSLPGYGYSQAAAKPGLSTSKIAVIMRNLMERLGYKKYVIQGGDWGAAITGSMARFYPDNIIGYHTNMAFVQSPLSTIKHIIGSFYPSAFVSEENEKKLYPIGDKYSFLLEETGYLHIQATKPDTIGVALRDSPVGLAAYILEKFSTWTNPAWKRLHDGGLTKTYTETQLLDNIMVYWDSQCITTSMRLYAETINKAEMKLKLESIPIKVPTAIARFEHEIAFMSDWQLREKYTNLVQISDFNPGGHFAAFEVPRELSEDIWSAVSKFDRISKIRK